MSETYVIQKGDSGLSIARKVYGHISWNNRELDAIKDANGITKENFKEIFKPGNTLVIPPLEFENESSEQIIKVATVSKLFPKHLMERSELIRYARTSPTKIEIDYDPITGEGFMNVYEYKSIQKYRSGE